GRVASEVLGEVALVRVLANRRVCSQRVAEEVAAAAGKVTPEQVAAEEARVKHNTRALVNALSNHVGDEAKPYIHFTATSFDIVDTATAWRCRRAAEEVLLPDLKGLVRILLGLARREKDTLQIGRTHGQHAVPVTFGFAVVQYVSRLGERVEAIERSARSLPGKFSGAVGAYNASALFFDDPEAFEAEVLAELGLHAAPCSTQIVHAEYLADFVHALLSAWGVLANLCDDMRHLQRTEIGEVGEAFGKDQVGSSTMPHKRNPANFENVKSLWKRFAPQMITVYADQISEHQRDLTNSASSRFIPEIMVGLACSVKRLSRVCERLVTDAERMRANLDLTAGLIAAEPAYILLAGLGHPHAHEAVRQLTLQAEAEGRSFWECMERATELKPYLDRLSDRQIAMLRDPTEYVGAASRKTEAVCQLWEERLDLAAD
ncbi:MAG: lyase family protein, partial [Armatimonadota bacterium]